MSRGDTPVLGSALSGPTILLRGSFHFGGLQQLSCGECSDAFDFLVNRAQKLLQDRLQVTIIRMW